MMVPFTPKTFEYVGFEVPIHRRLATGYRARRGALYSGVFAGRRDQFQLSEPLQSLRATSLQTFPYNKVLSQYLLRLHHDISTRIRYR